MIASLSMIFAFLNSNHFFLNCHLSCSAYEQPAERPGASPSVPLSDKFAMNLPVPQIPPLALAAVSHKASLVALLEADWSSSEVTHTTTFQVINLFRYPSATTHPWQPMLTICRSQEPCEHGETDPEYN